MTHRYKRVDDPQKSAFAVAAAGYPFILATAFATLVFALLELSVPAVVFLVATFAVAFFFRDPERFAPEGEALVVSPADGRVVKAEALPENPYFEGPCIKVGIFMTIFNVHVNRVPYTGRVIDTHYRPGRFVSADREAASLKNEHQAVVVETDDRKRICFVQVAGLVARRIICWLSPGEVVRRGERFGLICFGSRLDVYLPADTALKVKEGDRVKAGQSVLGELT
jgi:phosphatidylserine decarboxylase